MADKENASANAHKSRFGFRGVSLKADSELTPFERIAKSNSMISKPKRSVSASAPPASRELSEQFRQCMPSDAELRALQKQKSVKPRYDYKGRILELEELMGKYRMVLSSELSGREKYLSQLGEEESQRKKLIADYDDRIALYQKKIERLKAAHSEAETDIHVFRDKYQTLDADLRSRLDTIESQKRELSDLREQKRELESQLGDLVSQLQSLQGELLERERCVHSLELRVEAHESRADSDLGRAQSEAQQQREACAEWERRHASLESSLRACEARLSSERARADASESESATLRRSLQSQQDAQQRDVNSHVQRESQLESELENARSSQQESDARRQSALAELYTLETHLREQRSRLESDLSSAQSDLQSEKMSHQRCALELSERSAQLERCESDLSALRGEFEGSQSALSRSEESLRRLESALSKAQSEARVSEASLECLRRESETEQSRARKQLESVEQQSQRRQEELERRETELSAVRRDLSSLSDSLQQQRAEQREQQHRSELEKTKLKADFDLKLREMEAQLVWENSSFEKDAAKLKETYSRQIQQLTDERSALRESVRDLEAHLAVSERRAQESDLGQCALRHTIESLQEEISSLREKLQKNESDNASQGAQLQSLTESMNRVMSSQAQTHEGLKQTVESVQEERRRMESSLQSAQEEIARLRVEAASRESECDRLRLSMGVDGAQRLAQSEDRARSLQSRVGDLELDLTRARGREEKLRADLESERSAAQSAQSSAKEARASQERSEASLTRMSQERETQVRQLESTLAGLRSDLSRLTSQLDHQQQSHQERERALKSEIAGLKQTISDQEAQMAKCREAQRVISSLEAELQCSERQRRKLHNEIQDCKGNIRIVCRVRPRLPSEMTPSSEMTPIDYTLSGTGMYFYEAGCRGSKHSFNRVFRPECPQSDVFEEVSQLVQSALDGFNICLFAYGQTGSGKTYTMYGKPTESERGLVQRSIELIDEHVLAMKSRGWVYELEASFLEIYNETIHDLLLLPEGSGEVASSLMHEELSIKKDGKDVYVQGLTRVRVETKRQLLGLIQQAEHRRATSSTAMNDESSRSHTVFTLFINGRNAEQRISLSGKLNLCDLAGSERLSKSLSTGSALTEAKHINKSLSALSDVFIALSNKSPHVPFRNSKLTYLLQPCLSGDGKTLMVLNISPLADSAPESVCSLRFAA